MDSGQHSVLGACPWPLCGPDASSCEVLRGECTCFIPGARDRDARPSPWPGDAAQWEKLWIFPEVVDPASTLSAGNPRASVLTAASGRADSAGGENLWITQAWVEFRVLFQERAHRLRRFGTGID